MKNYLNILSSTIVLLILIGCEPFSVLKETTKPAVGNIYGQENKNFRVLVRSQKNGYIWVRDNNTNKLVVTHLFKTGDSYQVPNRSGLILITGLDDAMEIIVDGKLVPNFAKITQVRIHRAWFETPLSPEFLR